MRITNDDLVLAALKNGMDLRNLRHPGPAKMRKAVSHVEEHTGATLAELE